MTSGKSPLVLPSLVWIFGLLLGNLFNIPILVWTIFTIILFISLLFIKNTLSITLLLIVAAGILRFDLIQLKPANHISLLLESRDEIVQPVTGIIESEVLNRDGIAHFDLKILKIDSLNVTGRVRFIATVGDIEYGDTIYTIATISTLKSLSNPFSFNYKEYLNFRNIHGTGFARIPLKIERNNKFVISKIPIMIRKFLRERIDERCPENSGFLKAIIIGDRSDLEEIRSTLTRAGLSHILAVSGLHVALIAIVLFTILKIFIRHRIYLRFVTISFLILYGAVCSWSPSVSRAVIMISIYFLGQILQRKVNSNNCLFASLIIITAISPYQLFSVGLHLSFCAVYILLNVIPYFTSYLYRLPLKNTRIRKLITPVLLLILVSSILSIFLAPITLYNFNQFNLNGIFGNLLGIPLISIVLPLSLLVILMPPILHLPELFGSSLDLILQVFHWWSRIASNSQLHYSFIPFAFWQVILFYMFLITMFWILLSFRKFKISILIILLFLNTYFWLGNKSNEMKVIFFNCGLGDLAYIQTPSNKNIMIDCGPIDKDPSAFRRSALPYFQNKGIKTIEWLIITHAHNDHYGGLDDVMEYLEVENLVITDEFQTRECWERIHDKINNEGSNILTISDTTHLPLEQVSFKILHPDRSYKDSNINNMSIVARLDYGELSILFNGDLESEGEEYLISKYAHMLDCDITKVGHHGSKTSSSGDYLDQVTPQIAVISTSVKNRFDFPHETTLQKYSKLDEGLIITGRDGALTITSDGKNLECKAFNREEQLNIFY